MGCARFRYRSNQRVLRMVRCMSKNQGEKFQRRYLNNQNKFLSGIENCEEISDSGLNIKFNSTAHSQIQQKSEQSANGQDFQELTLLEQRWTNDTNSQTIQKQARLPTYREVVEQPVVIDTTYGKQHFSEGFGPQFVLINRAVIRATSPSQVIDIIQQSYALNGVNIASALYKIQDLIMSEIERWPKKGRKKELVTQDIVDFFQQYVKVYSQFLIFRPRCISNIIVSCGMLQISIPPKTVRLYMRYARELIHLFQTKDLQDLVLGITYLNINSELSTLLLSDITDRCIKLGEEFTPKEMSLILWAYASIQYNSVEIEQLCEIFAIQLVNKRKQIKTVEDLQVFSNAAWAFQQLGIEVKEVFKCLGILADSFRINLEVYSLDISEYRARVKFQAVSCFLWVLAKYNIYVTNFMQELSKQIPKMMKLLQKQKGCQFVSNLMYGYAVLCHYDQKVLDSLSQYFFNNIQYFNSQETSNCIWAMGFLGYEAERLNLNIVRKQILQKLQSGDFTMIACGQLLFGFSMLQYMPVDLFLRLAFYIQQRYIQLQETYEQEQLFTNIQIGYMTMEALNDIQQIQQRQCTIQNDGDYQSNISAETTRVQFSDKSFREEVEQVNNMIHRTYSQSSNQSSIQSGDKNVVKFNINPQVYNNIQSAHNTTKSDQFNDYSTKRNSDQNHSINFSDLHEILQLGRDAWRRMTRYCIASDSMLYSDIGRILSALDVQHVLKTMTRNGCLWIYLCCLCDDQPTAIEVHRRASDLTYNGDHFPMGMAKWRVWQLRLRGWHVLEINGYEWGLLTLQEKLEFLDHQLFLLTEQEEQQ